MNIPQRWQRSRAKGAKQPASCRYCGRGTIYANGFKIGDPHPKTKKPMTRADVLELFDGVLRSLISLNGVNWFVGYYLKELSKYKYLSCFCPLTERCHVDIWIEYLQKYEKELQP